MGAEKGPIPAIVSAAMLTIYSVKLNKPKTFWVLIIYIHLKAKNLFL